MKRKLFTSVSAIALVTLLVLLAFGQGGTKASLSGSVVDPTDAVISGATVIVKNNTTTAQFRSVTTGNGTFSVPALDPGTYTVTVTSSGFKQAVVNYVKLDAGVPASVRVSLEVGNTSESVVVQGGAEMVQTQSANISTTLNVNQISHLPLISRNALDFLVFLPGTTTAGTPRNTTINGLPQSALNITIDGINTQDNTLKTGDGFFSYISPRIDAIEEVTVSTATPGAESAGQGAVQIRFVTRQGSNEFHGSGYWYHRNPWLNSNYWFTNRDTTPLNAEGRRCDGIEASLVTDQCTAPRDRVLFNQYGFRLGGPISLPKKLFGPLGFSGKDRAFFFVNYEEFRQPTQITRQRTILHPDAQSGIFRYNRTVNNVTTVQTVDLLAKAQQLGHTSTIDPDIAKLLADIRNSTASTGGIQQLPDPNLQRFTFANSSNGIRYYPTIRLDFNLTENHHLESIYYYQNYLTTIDTLNNVDPAFPGFPNYGSQLSNRFAKSLALRSTLKPTLVNEARFGFTGGTVLFRPELNREMFTGPVANQLGYSLGINAAGITNATVTTAPSRRNAPTFEFSDTMTWTRGAHSLSFGGQFTQVNLWLLNQTTVPSITFGVNSQDAANAMFSTANFPGASNTQLTNAANIYAVLTGRVTAITGNANLNEETGQYTYLGDRVQRGRMRELGVFLQDSWRMRPNLTLNFGLRWELQLPFTPLNDSYTTSTIDDLFGISGRGNLFNPLANAGRETQYIQYKQGVRAYNADYRNFAPSFGFAWTPNAKQGWLKRIVGEGGQTVLRGGYSIAYNRNGMSDFSDVFGANPGSAISATRSTTIGNIGTLPLLLRDRTALASRFGPADFPTTPVYPFSGAPFVQISNSVNIFEPGLKVPYSQSWTFGIQREISKDMALEVRYVGTRNIHGWSTFDFNENNIVENGFLNEFKAAQRNLEIFKATFPNCGTTGNAACSFAFRGLPGQSPLPITFGYVAVMNRTSSNPNQKDPLDPNNPNDYTAPRLTGASAQLFTSASTTFINSLAANNPAPGTFSGNLYSDATRRQNAFNAGLAPNLFLVNPGLMGGANLVTNSGYTRYDSLQVDLRRRLSRGLLVQANYVFSKGFSSSRYSLRVPRVNTLATGNEGYLAHAFKANWVYELPIGRGRMLFGNAGSLLERLVGGWEFHGTARIQSGQILNFGNVRLIGMTQDEFRDLFKLRFDDEAGDVFHLPDDIIQNTIRAFNVSAISPTGYSDRGVPTGRYIAPANSPSCIQVVTGDCAPQNLYVTGPMFTRFDLSLVKKFKITESVNFELRGEFLNALNNINFLANTNMTNFTNDQFGQVTSAYRDPNNTLDPGGRLVQIVARFNW